MNWDIVIMSFSLFNCFTVPLKVTFNPPGMNNLLFDSCNYIIDFFFFIDILISFRSVVYDDKGEEISGGCKMASEYLKTTFLIDSLATIPFDLFVPSQNEIEIFGILKLGRILRLSKIIRYLRTTNDVKASLRIFKMVLFLSVYLHCYTCLWWQIVKNTKKWIPPMDSAIVGIDYSIYDSQFLK